MASSSQAAAMAAFSGLANKSRSELMHDKKKAPFVIPTPTENTRTTTTRLKRVPKLDTSLPTSSKLPSSRSAGQKTPQTTELQAPTHLHSLRDGRVTQSDKTGPSLAAVAAAASLALPRASVGMKLSPEEQTDGPPYRSGPKSSAIQGLKKSTSNHLNISVHSTTTLTLNLPKPADMIASVKNSIGSKMVHNDTSAMQQATAKVEEVRQSINAKAASRSSRLPGKYDETIDKNNTLNEFRDAVDLRRITTPMLKAPSSIYDRTDQTHSIYDRRDQNNSCSTFGSSMLENEVVLIPQTPTIVIDLLDKPELPSVNEPQTSGHANLNSSNTNIESFENSGRKLSSNDNLNTSNDNILIESRTLRRKPPPDDGLHVTESRYSDLGESFTQIHPTSSFVDNIGGQLVGNVPTISKINAKGTDIHVDDEKTDTGPTKFPRFPPMPLNHSRKSSDHFPAIFKTSKLKSRGVDNSLIPLDLSRNIGDGDDEPMDVVKNEQGIVRRQTKVQLKTTMRKTKKREMKKQFNENKPWKNHSDLSYISDQERKRYEGLWASNKGLYMSSVVSVLAGVQYDESSMLVGPSNLEDGESEKTEETEALKAALLSAKSVNAVDASNIHNLQSAEVNLLIHGVVVKRIWQRSRLPDTTLKEIWDLVDFRRDSTLNKEEFLVGMWLIDQCLYGRKLPKSVSPEIWGSITSNGLNVVIKRKGRK